MHFSSIFINITYYSVIRWKGIVIQYDYSNLSWPGLISYLLSIQPYKQVLVCSWPCLFTASLHMLQRKNTQILIKPLLREANLKSIKPIYHLICLLMDRLNIFSSHGGMCVCAFVYNAVDINKIIVIYLYKCLHTCTCK